MNSAPTAAFTLLVKHTFTHTHHCTFIRFLMNPNLTMTDGVSFKFKSDSRNKLLWSIRVHEASSWCSEFKLYANLKSINLKLLTVSLLIKSVTIQRAVTFILWTSCMSWQDVIVIHPAEAQFGGRIISLASNDQQRAAMDFHHRNTQSIDFLWTYTKWTHAKQSVAMLRNVSTVHENAKSFLKHSNHVALFHHCM